MIELKRVYEPPLPTDGRRILVDRLWPRGLSKRAAHVNEWLKEVAPSTELRKWFGHDPKKWQEFRRRYRRELRAHRAAVERIARLATRRRVTLVYGAKDNVHNDAVVLAAVLRSKMNHAASHRRQTKTRSHNA
ncbi:MAG TPA: DUF488 family protein [Gemmatimonadaceae bacterium]|nr:DUF488 family protein [Gemmatimonadaceae bacterium]